MLLGRNICTNPWNTVMSTNAVDIGDSFSRHLADEGLVPKTIESYITALQ